MDDARELEWRGSSAPAAAGLDIPGQTSAGPFGTPHWCGAPRCSALFERRYQWLAAIQSESNGICMPFGRAVPPLFIPLRTTVAASFHLLSYVLAVILAATMVLSLNEAARIRAAARQGPANGHGAGGRRSPDGQAN
jgi:hypothetical protein